MAAIISEAAECHCRSQNQASADVTSEWCGHGARTIIQRFGRAASDCRRSTTTRFRARTDAREFCIDTPLSGSYPRVTNDDVIEGAMTRAGLSSALVLLATTTVALTFPAWGRGFDGGHRDALGPRFEGAPQARDGARKRTDRRGADTLDRLRRWNEIAIDASGLDHTPVKPGETRVFGEQLGPGRASHAMAVVHIAIFDAVNAIVGGHRGYTNLPPARDDTSIDAAIAQAAHDTLATLYPSQATSFAAALAEDLNLIRVSGGRAKANGIELGGRAAKAILELRAHDGSHHAEPRLGMNPDVDFIPSKDPGKWRQDPISQIPLALGAHWGDVKPFVLRSGRQFRAPPPPAMGSRAYTAAFDEVKRLGGDGIVTPTVRTAQQTFIGIFWAYDGTPSLCAPPRLYNQITVQIAEQKRTGVVELARLL